MKTFPVEKQLVLLPRFLSSPWVRGGEMLSCLCCASPSPSSPWLEGSVWLGFLGGIWNLHFRGCGEDGVTGRAVGSRCVVVGTGPRAAPSLQGAESAVPESGAALPLPGDAPRPARGVPPAQPCPQVWGGTRGSRDAEASTCIDSAFSDPLAGGSSSLSLEPSVT